MNSFEEAEMCLFWRKIRHLAPEASELDESMQPGKLDQHVVGRFLDVVSGLMVKADYTPQVAPGLWVPHTIHWLVSQREGKKIEIQRREEELRKLKETL